MNPQGGAGSNPPAGGSSAGQSPTNPQAGGSANAAGATNPQAGGLPPQTPVPPTGQPAGDAGANSPAEGRNAPDNADATREAEWKRENQKLRQRLEALEAEKQAEADAKLSESERIQKQLAELQRKDLDHQIESQRWALQMAVMEESGTRRLHNVQDTVALLKQHYADQLDYDDTGKPTNVSKMLDRLLRDKPWLAAPEPSAEPQSQPNSGRVGTHPRGAPPRSNEPPKPVPPAEWPTLSQIEWSQPRDDLGGPGTGNK